MPSSYRLADTQGKERLWVFAARTFTGKENPTTIADRHEGYMQRIVSEDDRTHPYRCLHSFDSSFSACRVSIGVHRPISSHRW